MAKVEEGEGCTRLVKVGFGGAVVAVVGGDLCHFQGVNQREGVDAVVALRQRVFDEYAFFVYFAGEGLCFVVDLLDGCFGCGFAFFDGSDFFAQIYFGLALGKGGERLFDEAFGLLAVDAVGSDECCDLIFAQLVGGDGGVNGAVEVVQRLGLFFQVVEAQREVVNLAVAGVVLLGGFLGLHLQGDLCHGVAIGFGKLFEGVGAASGNGDAHQQRQYGQAASAFRGGWRVVAVSAVIAYFVLIFRLFFFSHGVAPGFVSTSGKWLRFAGFRWHLRRRWSVESLVVARIAPPLR